jgi:hypothetical protein
VSLSAAQVAALRELDEQWPEAKTVIIGATALGFYYEMRWRQTADVDLALAIELRDFPGALPERPGWKRHPRKQHEFRSPQSTAQRHAALTSGRLARRRTGNAWFARRATATRGRHPLRGETFADPLRSGAAFLSECESHCLT